MPCRVPPVVQDFKLCESFLLPAQPELDEEKGILRNVKVLGLESKNGKRYTKDAVKGALPLIEGARAFFDHAEEDEHGNDKPRKVSERFGRFKEAYQDKHGEAFANLHYNPHHERAASFVWFVKNDPVGIGCSIVGAGKGSTDSSGIKVVEQITRIASVDIVDGPATVSGLFEQVQHKGKGPGGGQFISEGAEHSAAAVHAVSNFSPMHGWSGHQNAANTTKAAHTKSKKAAASGSPEDHAAAHAAHTDAAEAHAEAHAHAKHHGSQMTPADYLMRVHSEAAMHHINAAKGHREDAEDAKTHGVKEQAYKTVSDPQADAAAHAKAAAAHATAAQAAVAQSGTPSGDAPAPGADSMDPNATPDAAGGDTWRTKLAELAHTAVSDATLGPDDVMKKLKGICKLIEAEEVGGGQGDAAGADAGEAKDLTAEKVAEQLKGFTHPAVQWALKEITLGIETKRALALREQAKTAGVPETALTPKFLEMLLREQTADGVTALIADRAAVAKPATQAPRTAPRDAPVVPGGSFDAVKLAASVFTRDDAE